MSSFGAIMKENIQRVVVRAEVPEALGDDAVDQCEAQVHCSGVGR